MQPQQDGQHPRGPPQAFEVELDRGRMKHHVSRAVAKQIAQQPAREESAPSAAESDIVMGVVHDKDAKSTTST